MRKDLLLFFFITISTIVNAQSIELKDAFAKVSSTLKDYKFESQDVSGCYPNKVVGTKSIAILLQNSYVLLIIDDDMRRVLMDNTPIDFYAGERHGKKILKAPISHFYTFTYGDRLSIRGREGIEITCNNKKELIDSYTIKGAELSLNKLQNELTTLISIAKNENFNGKLGVVAEKVINKGGSSATKPNRNKTIRMKKMVGNTYLISCKVNGLPLDFIFDTGASSVTLSKKQAVFMLKNGYLSKSDIIGSNAYQTATGDIAIGTVIRLKKIDINGLILNNVEASIINSDSAPLLLGQSALSRLGKMQIDYKNSTLTIIR